MNSQYVGSSLKINKFTSYYSRSRESWMLWRQHILLYKQLNQLSSQCHAIIIMNQNPLTSTGGRLKRNSLSNLPGRRKAGSIESILLVAPITTTSPLLSNPSIRANRVDTILECIWSCLLDLTGARPSISSKNMIAGRTWYACIGWKKLLNNIE